MLVAHFFVLCFCYCGLNLWFIPCALSIVHASNHTTHSGFKWLKPAKNKLTWSDFTNFFMQVFAYSNSFRFWSFHSLHIQNLSNRRRYKYDPSISRIFFNLIFGGFLTFGTTVYCLLRNNNTKWKLKSEMKDR